MGRLYLRGTEILTLLRRQQDTVKSVEAATGRPTRSIANGPAGSVPLSGELLDELVVLYEPRGEVGGYALRKGLPALTLRVEKKRGGVHIVVEPVCTHCRASTTATFIMKTPFGSWNEPKRPVCCPR